VKLDPGYYIVRMRGMHFGCDHVLRVFRKGKEKYFKFDAEDPFFVDNDNESYELEKFVIAEQLSGKIDYQGFTGTIGFSAETLNGSRKNSYEFSFGFTSEEDLNKVKRDFPRLWMKFQRKA